MIGEVMEKMSKLKKLLTKKWLYPVLYLGAAALILGLMWSYQVNNLQQPLTKEELGLETKGETVVGDTNGIDQLLLEKDAVSVATNLDETIIWPVINQGEITISDNFYDANATDELKAKSLIKYDNRYFTHNGVDITAQDGKAFEVVAALSGEVKRAEYDPLVGYVVEIKHNNNLTTIYQSMDQLTVKKGDQVKQGDLLGMSGRNLIEKELGNHLHFEVQKDEIPTNPHAYIKENGSVSTGN